MMSRYPETLGWAGSSVVLGKPVAKAGIFISFAVLDLSHSDGHTALTLGSCACASRKMIRVRCNEGTRLYDR